MSVVDLIKSKITEDKVELILRGNGAVNVHKVGDSLRCGCPLHGGHNSTGFKWDLKENLWVCHSGDCGGGDIFHFIANINDLSIEHDFVEIIKITAELLGVDLTGISIEDLRNQLDKERTKWVLYMKSKLNKQVNKPYDIRNLGELYKLNNHLGFPREFLDKHGIYFAKDYNRIAFSIYDHNGAVVGASLRRVSEADNPKWLHRPKSIMTGHVLYNLNNIEPSIDTVYICEGMKDVLRLKFIGVNNAVATFGTNIAMEQIALLSRFLNVIVLYDNDNGGKKGTLKAIKTLRNIFNLKVIDLAELGINDPFEIETIEQFNELKAYKPHEYLAKYNLNFKDL